MNRTDLQQLAETRLREAEILLNAGEPSGAYYLAGYAVECGLKACIAKQTNLHDFPEKDRVNKSYSHKFSDLVVVAGLQASFDVEFAANPGFRKCWKTTQAWNERSRYSFWSVVEADELIKAIDDHHDGVLRWIKQYW